MPENGKKGEVKVKAVKKKARSAKPCSIECVHLERFLKQGPREVEGRIKCIDCRRRDADRLKVKTANHYALERRTRLMGLTEWITLMVEKDPTAPEWKAKLRNVK